MQKQRLWRALVPVLGVLLAVTIAFPAAASWPVATTRSYVSQWYSRRHPAIDIAARKWTPVIAAHSGLVRFAGYRRNCGGRQVYIAVGNGRYQAYYHLARVKVRRDQRVIRGQTIGWVGTTGCTTGPHLHFEQWRGYPWSRRSYRYNPWPYLDDGKYLPVRYR